jgi:two-component system cell cycle sensor histidine kinase/response regulator CckA
MARAVHCTYQEGQRSLTAMQQTDSTILVVDDEQALVDLTTAILNNAGFTALGTTDPDEALRMVEHDDSIGVLLSDVMMPKATGPELVRRAQRIRSGDLRILFMSGGFDDVRFRQTDRILEKPWTREELLGEIRRVISKSPPKATWHGPERRKRAA